MVALRLDRCLQSRVDPSDIIQEASSDASARLADDARHPETPFFLWLRCLTGQRLLRVHRQHRGAEMRDIACEVALKSASRWDEARRTEPPPTSRPASSFVGGGAPSPDRTPPKREAI